VENNLFANIKNICWWEWQGQKTWWGIFLQSCTSCWSCSSLKRRKLVRRCLSQYNSSIRPNWEWLQFSTTYQQFRVGLWSPQRVLSLTNCALHCVHCAWQNTIQFDTGWIKWEDERQGSIREMHNTWGKCVIAHSLPALQASWLYRSKLWTSSKWDVANRKIDCLKFPWQVHALQLEIP
jgi:hypothetical protein